MGSELIRDVENEPSYELYQRGRKAMDTGDFNAAIVHFQDSIKHFPHFKTLELLGECLLKIGDNVAAIVPLAAAATLDSSGFRGSYLLSRAFLEIQDFQKAPKYVDRAIQLRPDFKRASDLKKQIISQACAEESRRPTTDGRNLNRPATKKR